MKKIFLALFFTASCAGFCSAAREFVEGTDYFAEYKQNEENMAAVLRINFTNLTPDPEEAESILKDQLTVFGQILETEKEVLKKEKEEAAKEQEKKEKTKKGKTKKSKEKDVKEIDPLLEEEEEEKFKNIIGSVWYGVDDNPENMAKVQYSENSSAFVWLGKTQKIVPFPEYIKFLKKEKEQKKQKEKEKALLLKQLTQQGSPDSEEESEESALD
ncbi:MAG: hypothetical protein LBL00_08430 [Endomicrobium sp.]|jgi:hypothetical protein|nr:hypothetical protein [Endomicrobium sp.]